MGYQETWFYITPQKKFNEMIRACARLEKNGRYERMDTFPTDVVTLKEPFGDLPAGAKLLWVCGERCFQNVEAMLEKPPAAGPFRRCQIQVIPVERVLDGYFDARMEGIMPGGDTLSENRSMKCQRFTQYAKVLTEREVCR